MTTDDSAKDFLKLTTYFAERARTDGRFLAETMLDRFDEASVAVSVMLRGIASFGPRNIIRTDATLTMSEDPPVAVAAVDTAAKISTLVDDVVAMTGRGLITLERARLVGAEDTGLPVPDGGHPVKLTLYVGRQQRVAGRPAHVAVCGLLRRHGFDSAVSLLGVDGTFHGQRERARFFSRNVNVPVMVIAVGEAERAEAAAAELTAMLPTPLLTVERVQVCKREGELVARPYALPPADARGAPLWQKLMVYTGEASLYEGEPIHRALVRRLREGGVASGATVLRSVWGFRGAQQPRGDSMFRLTRQVPVTSIVVDSPERIAHTFDIIDDLTTNEGLVTCEMVPALVAVDGEQRGGGTTLAQHRY